MLRITNLQVPFADETPLELLAAKRLRLPPGAVAGVTVVRQALDARRYRGSPIRFVYTLDAELREPEQHVLARLRGDRGIAPAPVLAPDPMPVRFKGLLREHRPVVVGFGPAGIFAALALARAGCSPLVLERGRDVDRRWEDVQRFWRTGALDPASNVQFGEGGAGAFSDGKLTTRIHDRPIERVLEAFVAAGAPEEIRYLHKPHLGTDRLRRIVKGLRGQILALGGEVRFEAQVTGIEARAGQTAAVIVNGEERVPASAVFLAIGHSARDTYEMLLSRGIAMEPKAFAMGLRIEHPQELIDRAQYGEAAGHPRLPPADYALTFQDRGRGLSAYTFCMCPGGQVVAAASEAGGVAVNGMSCYRRDSGIANSALLAPVQPRDFGMDVLAGMRLQRACESQAFALGGGDCRAPVQSVGDFLRDTAGAKDFLVRPSYLPGVRPADLRQCLPPSVAESLASALPAFGRKIPGFDAPDAPLTGVETRSSAPCRILRDPGSRVSVSLAGLYPVGEGAGYAGGIVSAAVDGMQAALAFLAQQAHTVEGQGSAGGDAAGPAAR